MANNLLTITFDADATDVATLQFTQVQLPLTLIDNFSFQWENSPNTGATDPYEVQVATPTGTPGEATAIEFANKWNTDVAPTPGIFTVIQTLNVVTIEILAVSQAWELPILSGVAGSAVASVSGTPNGNSAILVFTSEGIDTTEVTMEINKPDIPTTTNLVFDWTNTPTLPYEIPVEPTVGAVGEVTAQNFADNFIANENQTGDYIVIVNSNVVTIHAIHPSWTFFYNITNTAGTADVVTSTNNLTLDSQILGQDATPAYTYCYLYEPLRVSIMDTDLTSTKLFVDLVVKNTIDGTTFETLTEYGLYDINPGKRLSIDLMKIVQQHHDAGVYKYSHIDEIVEDIKGWHSSVSKYKYEFVFYTDNTDTTPVSVLKLPILGNRRFLEFSPTVTQNNKLTEADLIGIDLDNRWLGYPFIKNELSDPTSINSAPNLTKVVSASGKHPCGGYIIWKSRLGGWMSWGMDIKTESSNHKYKGNIDVGYFESTEEFGGQPYIETDYTSITTAYTLSMKALSLSSEELEAVIGIKGSPAIYFMKDSSGTLELMRLSAATARISTLASGGDFSVSLKSVSRSSQRTR